MSYTQDFELRVARGAVMSHFPAFLRMKRWGRLPAPEQIEWIPETSRRSIPR